ncbi:hypothetical protein NESM_000786800 [Novymonas esmeraldas]|uniref:Uncharacterized protein n=1 Tax=Novymonas esmeraldas TaxID=1808958 RepID=A0AAW0EW09_9TRYP
MDAAEASPAAAVAATSLSAALHPTLPTRAECHALLQQLRDVQLRVEERLGVVDAEMQCLEALRVSLTLEKHRAAPARRRAVAVAVLRDDGKRNRDDADGDDYAAAARRMRRGDTLSRTHPPFCGASLYVCGGNPAICAAAPVLSDDETARREVELLFPGGSAIGVAKQAHMPKAAATRLAEVLTEAGLRTDAVALSTASLRQCVSAAAAVRRDGGVLKSLCTAVPAGVVRALCSDSIGDPSLIASCLYTHVAEQAVVRALVLPALRANYRELLRLPPPRQQLQMEAMMWTLSACCHLSDRDLVENTHVQWCRSLQCAAPTAPTVAPHQRAAYAHGWAQLLGAIDTADVRQGYLFILLAVCGGFLDLLDAAAAPLRRRATPFRFGGVAACAPPS